jgi:hypothetical protein
MVRFVMILGFVLLAAVAVTAAIGLVASLDWWAILSTCFVVDSSCSGSPRSSTCSGGPTCRR